MKVLAVDDSPAILELIRDILTKHNHEVDTADNGAQALDKYYKSKPDVVTLDILMPVMDGYETLKRIRNFDNQANVIMLTASEQENLLSRCLQMGAAGYILKPFTPDEFMTELKNALTAGDDRNILALFSIITTKIDSTLKKMFDSSVSVTLNHVETVRQETSAIDINKIGHVLDIKQPPGIHVSEESAGYVSEMKGQQSGMLVSVIKKRDLEYIIGDSYKGNDMVTSDEAIELFNIFNVRIMSEIANATHLILDISPAKIYTAENDNTYLGKELTRAKFEITFNEKNIPVEVNLLLDIKQVFMGF